MGQRLSVVEPPIIPDEPVWPNPLLIFGLGVGGSAALGLILALTVELLLRPIRDPKSLASITGFQPLGVIPAIPKKRLPGPRFRWFRRKQRDGVS